MQRKDDSRNLFPTENKGNMRKRYSREECTGKEL